MANFKPDNYNQTTMLVVNFKDQIELDSFAHTIHTLIDTKIDLSAFHEHFNNEAGS